VDGVNIDYEGLDGSCGSGDPYWAQHAMTAFAQKMRAALGASTYISIDTYSGAAGDPYGFFDIAGLGTYVDSMFVMAYDMEYSNYSSAPVYCSSFCLGPTSPLAGYRYNDTSVMSRYVALVPANKVILGVPYYGRKACVGSAILPNQYPTSSVVADSYLDASGEAAYYEVKPGSYAIHRDTHSAGMERWDTWYNTTLGCTRELYWDDAVSLGKKYDLVNADGLRGVGIWNLNYGGGAPELWAALQTHFLACTGAALTVSPGPPQPYGVQVRFAATSAGCSHPLYQFWILAGGSTTWRIAQAYSTSATFNWNTAGLTAGTYRYTVWVRDASSAGRACNNLGCFDTFSPSTAYTLTSPCRSVTASALPAGTAPLGTTVTFSAVASGCSRPLYQFWFLAPGSTWTIARAYSTITTFTWSTGSLHAGTYRYVIWVRDSGSPGISCNNLGCFDAYSPSTAYKLSTPCRSVTESAAPASPQLSGVAISFTAGASGCPHPLYQFWLLAPGSTWTVAQAYSGAATYKWSTSGLVAGTYHYTVWARDASSVGTSCSNLGCSDALVPMTPYALSSPCRSVTESAAPAAQSLHGTSITFNAAASGCPHPLYQFWILAPGSTWTIVQAYSTSSTFSWNTAGLPPGAYRYTVWVRDSASPGTSCNSLGCFDAYAPSTAYTLT